VGFFEGGDFTDSDDGAGGFGFAAEYAAYLV